MHASFRQMRHFLLALPPSGSTQPPTRGLTQNRRRQGCRDLPKDVTSQMSRKQARRASRAWLVGWLVGWLVTIVKCIGWLVGWLVAQDGEDPSDSSSHTVGQAGRQGR